MGLKLKTLKKHADQGRDWVEIDREEYDALMADYEDIVRERDALKRMNRMLSTATQSFLQFFIKEYLEDQRDADSP